MGIGIWGIALRSWNWEMGIGISEIGHATILPPSTGNAETLIQLKQVTFPLTNTLLFAGRRQRRRVLHFTTFLLLPGKWELRNWGIGNLDSKKLLHLPIHSCSHEDALLENLGIRCVEIRYVGIGISGIALCSWNWEMGIGNSEIGHATILPPSTGNAETLISVKAK